MKAMLMEAMPAIVLSGTQLRDLLAEAAREGAKLAVQELRADLHQSPDDATLQKLRAYLSDPASVPTPHDQWAHSGLIRQIEPTPRGKPKSMAWFMTFQRQTGLAECFTRHSPAYGRRREWCFADIRLAWNVYYSRK